MAPLRFLAIAYIDVFRAIPLIILLYLVAFGIPIAEIPVLSDLPTPWLVVIALTVTTSAYVAEVFRSGIETGALEPDRGREVARLLDDADLVLRRRAAGVPARPAAAPQLLHRPAEGHRARPRRRHDRRVREAKIYAGNYFNLSSVTFVAIVFILATIPQTRFVDYLIARQARKTGVRAL